MSDYDQTMHRQRVTLIVRFCSGKGILPVSLQYCHPFLFLSRCWCTMVRQDHARNYGCLDSNYGWLTRIEKNKRISYTNEIIVINVSYLSCCEYNEIMNNKVSGLYVDYVYIYLSLSRTILCIIYVCIYFLSNFFPWRLWIIYFSIFLATFHASLLFIM